ncbi:amino acid deaminase [Pseudonocardia sp. TRM90224]|uniref:amino acid deaminase n=1 Tax=Pseudonocardia sp. TRM90224 TaxID=2812678 RepID=UPI001E5D3361|nr:amino acid deaminase [Pseudonocardia sp. TRM90224]
MDGTSGLHAWDKSLPAAADGMAATDFVATKPRLSTFSTPLLVLSSPAMDANLDRMAAHCAEHGLALAPHGKTTMAPALWDRMLRAGAWGITIANAAQLRVAVTFGVRRIIHANALVDPVALAWLADVQRADAGLQVLTWVDSTGTVAAMDAALATAAPSHPIDVLVELGAPNARTGARDVATAQAVAAAVDASPYLRLAGTAGYEGSLAHDATDASLAIVRRYLQDLAELHGSLAVDGDSIITAGGSSFFDVVTEVLAPLAAPGTEVVLRSGAYMIHDDGFYRRISPFSRDGDAPFRSAMHAWARVISQPEPGLALLDAGKRDVPYDEGLPVPQLIADQLGAPAMPLEGEITAVNDQHAYLRYDPATVVRVGQVVRLGLSHPCTAFDKWRWIPVIDEEDVADPVVTELVRTYF